MGWEEDERRGASDPRQLCYASTDITEQLSMGRGNLDSNGFWQFPCEHTPKCGLRSPGSPAEVIRAEARRAAFAEAAEMVRAEAEIAGKLPPAITFSPRHIKQALETLASRLAAGAEKVDG